MSISLIVSSVLTWLVGRKLNANPIKMLLDPETNQQYIMRKEHSLFFIKMEYWAIPQALLGIVFWISTWVFLIKQVIG
jgi:hypothetical protein